MEIAMGKERLGEIALLVAKTLLKKYGHLIKFEELIMLIASEPGVTAEEAGVFLKTITLMNDDGRV